MRQYDKWNKNSSKPNTNGTRSPSMVSLFERDVKSYVNNTSSNPRANSELCLM